MTKIRLERTEWQFDEGSQLGPAGGFGEVFAGSGPNGPVAIKRLKLTAAQAAHREMTIGRSLAERSLTHIVPVLDWGQDGETDRYYLVMPVCEQSLQDRLGTGLAFDDAKAALLNIAGGLAEVGDLVHRDLKPANVLFHEGLWKVADFGIAKFVEDSTSLETLRGSLTPAYGAPEQWIGERPTKATDMYALACIAHALFNGAPPFGGTADDVREGHLRRQPPPLKAPGALAAVVAQMLRKAPEARPSLERFVSVLGASQGTTTAGPRAALAAAAEKVAQEKSAAEAVEAERRSKQERWEALAVEGEAEIRRIIDRLLSEIEQASIDVNRRGQSLTWGKAALSFTEPRRLPQPKLEPAASGDWITVSSLVTALSCQAEPVGYGDTGKYEYGSTLFFARRKTETEYRWREVSFWSLRGSFENSPFGLDMLSSEANIALSRTVGMANVAMQPTPIDAEDEHSFQNRWLSLVARAAAGALRRPNQMPPPTSFYD